MSNTFHKFELLFPEKRNYYFKRFFLLLGVQLVIWVPLLGEELRDHGLSLLLLVIVALLPSILLFLGLVTLSQVNWIRKSGYRPLKSILGLIILNILYFFVFISTAFPLFEVSAEGSTLLSLTLQFVYPAVLSSIGVIVLYVGVITSFTHIYKNEVAKRVLELVKPLLVAGLLAYVIGTLFLLVLSVLHVESLYNDLIVQMAITALAILIGFWLFKIIRKHKKYFNSGTITAITLGVVISLPITFFSMFAVYPTVFTYEPAGIEARNICHKQITLGMSYEEVEAKFGHLFGGSIYGNGSGKPWPLDEDGNGQVYLKNELKYLEGSCRVQFENSKVKDSVMLYVWL